MTKREYRTLETPTGQGQVCDLEGDLIADVSYSLNVQQEMIVTRTFSGISRNPGVKDISGEITVLEIHSDNVIRLGEKYVLHLDDGRQWQFLVADAHPSSGFYYVRNASGKGLAPK